MNNLVCWFESYVQDTSRAKALYENVFSVELDELNIPDIEMWTSPVNSEGTGTSGAIVKMEGCPSWGNSTMVYFNGEDCAVEEHKPLFMEEKYSEQSFPSAITDLFHSSRILKEI